MITADNLTDEQIDALWRESVGPGPHAMADPDTMHMCTVAVNRKGDFSAIEQRAARWGCAEILNARLSLAAEAGAR